MSGQSTIYRRFRASVRVGIVTLLLTLPGLVGAQEQPLDTAFVAWSPDGSMLSVAFGNTIDIIDSYSGEILNTFSELYEYSPPPVWSPDSTRLAIVNNADVEIWASPWDPETSHRQLTYQYYADLDPPEPTIGVTAIAWDPDGTKIAAAIGAMIDVWHVETGVRLFRLRAEDWTWTLRYNQDGILAGGSTGAYVTLWDGDTGAVLKYYYISTFGIAGIGDVVWSPDGHSMFISYDSSSEFDEYGIEYWDITAADSITYSGQLAEIPNFHLEGHTRDINTLAWSTDARYVVTGSRDGTVRVWDAETEEQISLIPVGTNLNANVRSVAFSPDGMRLAYGNTEGGLEVVSLLCTLTTRFGVNLRRGPGQDYEQAGSRVAAQPLEANGQLRGSDGFIWWRLSSGEWLREDLVTEESNCETLPQLETVDISTLLDDVCTITVIERANMRDYPDDQNSNIVGSAEPGEALQTIGYFPDTQGNDWWRAGSGWIRGDLVAEASDCSRIEQLSVYEAFPDLGGGPCVLRTLSGVNLRSGSGTQYDRAGSLPEGYEFEPTGQFSGDDGFVWWQLETGEWVREDLVSESEFCSDVPVVTP